MINLKFKSLDVEGFQSIGKANIDFNNLGTCLITGRNNADDKVKSNGAGKSSLIISLIWCLFGSTPNGIKNEVVNSYYKNGCSVLLDFNVDDVNYKIRRSIKHKQYKTGISILRNDEDVSAKNKKDSDDIIKEILNIDKDLFLQLIFLSQGFGNRFTLYTPKARKELLESLYNINEDLDNFVENIKLKESEFKAEQVNLLNKKAQLNANINSANNSNEQLKHNIEIETQSIKALEDSKTNISEEEIKQLEVDINELNEQLNEFTEKRNNIVLKKNSICNGINNIVQKINESNIEIFKLQKNKLSNICPTCGQQIIDADSHNHKLNEFISEHKTKVNDLEIQKQEIQNKVDLLNKKQLRVSDIISVINNNLNNLNGQYKTKQKDYNIQLTKESTIGVHKATINSYNEMINKNNELITLNENELLSLNKLIEINEENLNIATQIIRLAGNQFKSYLLEDIICQLNLELVKLSKSLFENRVIQISNGNKLDVMLNDKIYEQLSGGEQNKVNIGIIIAQRKLAQKMNSISSNILICDEIFDGLDDVSFNIVLDLLSDEMQDVESIIIISHRSINEIPFDHQIEVVKNKDQISKILIN